MKIEEYLIGDSPQPSEIKRASILQEMNSIRQPVRLLSRFKSLTKSKQGNGQRIMLIPGWLSHDTSMYPMKFFLKRLGYKVSYWGLGINRGKIEVYRDQLVERIQQEKQEDKLTLIGWSLGGLVAREIARELPSKIASVITYGTPVVGGPKYTIGSKVWGARETNRIIKLSEELDRTKPITVPITAIFTKKDSIVNWSACLDRNSKNVKHYEVDSTHLSLGIDPKVWEIVSMHLQENSKAC